MKGVRFNKARNTWIARETNGDRKQIGSFQTEREAEVALTKHYSDKEFQDGVIDPETEAEFLKQEGGPFIFKPIKALKRKIKDSRRFKELERVVGKAPKW